MARGRKRMWAGWGLVVLGLVVAVVMVASRWFQFNHMTIKIRLTIDGGAVLLSRGTHSAWDVASFQEALGGFRKSMTEPNLQWWIPNSNTFDSAGNPGLAVFVRPTGFFGYSTITDSNGVDHYVSLFLLLWSFALAAFLPGAALVVMGRRVARRARLGHCPACNYNLSGLAVGAACPECGGGASGVKLGSQA